ncbi:putative DNA ligase [Pseudomonas phage Ep4]|uniref:DNA ligase n=1 Tax=Pseudomonas phage Ep4 TaxID=3057492 RepID=A0AAU9EZB2_9CAUD|nr:putative DNA ligase [Pseudomonas phage Ep4]
MAKQARYAAPNAHRPVSWNEKAVLKAFENRGYLFAQVKEDGIRFHAWLDEADVVRIVTREGIEIKSLIAAKEALRELLCALPDGFVLDGEATVPGLTFEAASGALRRSRPIEDAVTFFVWDTFPLTALLGTVAGFTETYADRLHLLVGTWANTQTPMYHHVELIECETVHSLEAAQQFFDGARAQGKEGLVLKDPDQPMTNGKRSGQWKMKASETCDGLIRGYVWGTPGLGNAGRIIGFTVELESGTLCDVTGLTQGLMDDVTAERQQNSGGPSALGRYVEIAYMEQTANGSLRHPSFVRFRDMDYASGWKA